MRVAVFYPRSLFSAWSVSEGICDTLLRMGHEVLPCGIEPGAEKISRCGITQEKLESCDLILVSGPEHIALGDWRGRDYLSLLFPEFDKLKVKKVAWLHETVQRADYPCDMPIDRIKKRFDVVYTPASQDEKYGLTFLPFGVDTVMFQPFSSYDADRMYPAMRDIDVAFIGLMYGPRQEFYAKLKPLLGDIKLTIGNCQVVDLSGVNIRKSVELYASELRRCKVLLNMPSLCRHTVTKITEAAACGCAVVTEAVENNRNNFINAVYYSGENGCASGINRALGGCPIGKQLCEEVHKNHRLDQRLATILQ